MNRLFYRLNPTQILALGFATLIILGTIFLSLPYATAQGTGSGIITALFTSTSAVCVTGLVVEDTGTFWSPFGKTVILLLIQAGGLGFMTLTSFFALAIGKRISFKERLHIQEALNEYKIQGIVRYVKYIIIMTFIIEGIGAILLSFKFIPQFGLEKGIVFSIFHAVSAFCNAGFDIMGNYSSLTNYRGSFIVNITVMALIVLGGLGFNVIYEVIRKKSLKRLSLHSSLVLRLTSGLIIIGFILIFVLEYGNMDTLGGLSLKEKILSSFFHSITPRTAGFNTLPTDQLTTGALIITMLFMFIGASSASCAGGIKITTAGVLYYNMVSTIKGKKDTEVFKKRIPQEIIDRAIVIIVLSASWVVFVSLVLSITEKNTEFIVLLFESMSSFGTVGLSMGITPELSNIGRIVISMSMFVGRLGPLTIVLALSIRQLKNNNKYRYPEEKVSVG